MVRRSARRTKKATGKGNGTLTAAVAIIILLAVIAAGIWWWRSRPEKTIWPVPDEGKVAYLTLYFPDSSDNFLIPVQRKVTLGKVENKYVRAIKELLRGPYEDPENLLPSMPARCNVLSVEVAGKTARVDFNSLTLDLLDETSETWFYKSVMHTLAAFDEVDRVDFSFEGRRIAALPKGTDVSQPRTPGDINISNAPLPKGDTDKIVLYFPDKSKRYLIPITEYIPGQASKTALVGTTMRRFIEGPAREDRDYLGPVFNEGVSVQDQGGIVEENGKLRLAFDMPDLTTAMAIDGERALTALRATFKQLIDFTKFDVTINGRPASDVIGSPVPVNEISPNDVINLLAAPEPVKQAVNGKGNEEVGK